MHVDFRHVVAHNNNNGKILSIITQEAGRKCHRFLIIFFFR